MTFTDKIILERADVSDADEIVKLQKLAYISEAEIIDDFTIPPLKQSVDEIVSEFDSQSFLKVVYENKIVGSVRCYLKDRTCYIGKLIVHPQYQNSGIGTILLYEAENQFRETERFELFTGQKSEKNLYIYQKNGYRSFKNEVVSEKLTLVYLEKINFVA